MGEQNDTPTPQRAHRRRQGQRLTKAERDTIQTTFLDAFKRNANVTAACQKAGISRDSIYTWLEHDEAFSLRYHQAELEANDMLLAAAWQRGVIGVEEPVVSMGGQVYEAIPVFNPDGTAKLDSRGRPVFKHGKPLVKRVYSDSVLLRLMSYRIPGFKEATGTTINNVNVQVERNELYARMHDDELDQLERLWNVAQERRTIGNDNTR